MSSRLAAVEVEKATNPYVSPKELMARWRCSRSQVDRIATRENFTRLLLGRGKNGMVRYLWEDVVRLEEGAKA
jgi:hypothetical protein